MPLVASTDYPNKRIYLHADSVGQDVQPIDIYKELRAERRLDETKRRFDPMLTAFGNDPAGPSNTPRFANLATGCRIVPYDSSHILSIVGALISTADGLAGPDLFDRAPLGVGVEVDIDYQPPQVEIIYVNTGSAVTEQDKDDIASKTQILILSTESFP